MKWIRHLSADLAESAEIIGGKAFGLTTLMRLGLPVPPAFVVTTAACRVFLHTGQFPDGLGTQLAAAVAELGARQVSVRSGSEVSMPGMMNTVLNVDREDVERSVAAVFGSWNTPRAKTYRALNDIPEDLGTAVTVQKMVYGNHDEHSGTGVAFSRNPNTGEPIPYGDVLFGHQGEAVVSGTSSPLPLAALDRETEVLAKLTEALAAIEDHYRDACYVEFTFEAGELWFLQVRPGRFTGRAAIRVAVDLADADVISRAEAVHRISRHDIETAQTAHMTAATVLARGLGACPGVATGAVVTTSDKAAQASGPVILVRPETSPLDMHGLAAAKGVVTARGGPASHAAVVARAMGKPAVVGVQGLTVDHSSVNVDGRVILEGTLVTIDGTSGEIALGQAEVTTAENDPHLTRLLGWT
ncbi:PEP/pyruvate-binding domain-containing protein [Kibdelosporangium phytohabitans]|uniref:PEP/pyruvate-binding domain-containing protein n=1 Tax=Kibdelosporangium phytohabitans TaxID=860235 RepID=UPI0007C81773|nr:PEP/pyruvate-binding domain-containing protein [Kibdelosporangium phytohabitans]MBE1465208.1 pyruvate,orthophosphate dikinase [Kibdelosporangium phytohabitans]